MNTHSKTRMTREERRKQILESALSIFIEKGYNRSTTNDIAKESGISEVTLFRYFDSKKQLFMAAIEPILIKGLKEFLVASEDLSKKEKFSYILKDRITFIAEHDKVIKLILMESQINPEVAEINFISKVTSLLMDSIKNEGVELKNIEFSLRIIMASILSFLYLPKKNDKEIDSYIKNLADMLIN